jgi:hypothetical protein
MHNIILKVNNLICPFHILLEKFGIKIKKQEKKNLINIIILKVYICPAAHSQYNVQVLGF